MRSDWYLNICGYLCKWTRPLVCWEYKSYKCERLKPLLVMILLNPQPKWEETDSYRDKNVCFNLKCIMYFRIYFVLLVKLLYFNKSTWFALIISELRGMFSRKRLICCTPRSLFSLQSLLRDEVWCNPCVRPLSILQSHSIHARSCALYWTYVQLICAYCARCFSRLYLISYTITTRQKRNNLLNAAHLIGHTSSTSINPAKYQNHYDTPATHSWSVVFPTF